MRCNIYKDQMESAELFGKPVLHTSLQIERESIPENWYCYDLTASDRNPVKPVTLEDHAIWNCAGTVLSPVPLKRETTPARQIRNSFCLRCTTGTGDYGYLYCYDLSQQKLAMEQEQALQQYGFSAEGLQRLQNTADPSIPHTYKWYLLQDCNTPAEQMCDGLSLEDAIKQYANSDNEDKHLGVTKDGIAAVDLLITYDGQEWYSEDYQKSDSFKDDPVIARAIDQIHRTLDEPEPGMTMGGM